MDLIECNALDTQQNHHKYRKTLIIIDVDVDNYDIIEIIPYCIDLLYSYNNGGKFITRKNQLVRNS